MHNNNKDININGVPLRQDHEDALPRGTTYSLIIMLLPKASVSRTRCGRVHILSMYNTDNINNAYNNINNVHEPFRQDHKDALPRDTQYSSITIIMIMIYALNYKVEGAQRP